MEMAIVKHSYSPATGYSNEEAAVMVDGVYTRVFSPFADVPVVKQNVRLTNGTGFRKVTGKTKVAAIVAFVTANIVEAK